MICTFIIFKSLFGLKVSSEKLSYIPKVTGRWKQKVTIHDGDNAMIDKQNDKQTNKQSDNHGDGKTRVFDKRFCNSVVTIWLVLKSEDIFLPFFFSYLLWIMSPVALIFSAVKKKTEAKMAKAVPRWKSVCPFVENDKIVQMWKCHWTHA